MAISGAIDCDIHPAVPSVKALFPYMSEVWREAFVARGQDGFNMMSYPPRTALSCRPDWRREGEMPGSNFELLREHALDGFGARFAICNVMYGGQIAVSEYMSAAMCSAVNDWIAAEWLDKDKRLRASIVVPISSPDFAVAEIERKAADKRFVQVLLPVSVEMMLGKRYYWPIYEAALKHNLPIGLHAGSSYRYAPTATGWPTHYLQDYVANSAGFEDQLLSLVSQGVFTQFPDLKIVLMESGVSWLPGFLWRARKTWRAMRSEVPWVKDSPIEIIRNNVRLTMQPIDAPEDPQVLGEIIDQIGSDDMLLFASDYPHWQFDGDRAVPAGFPDRLIEKIAVDNPLKTYPRLGELVP